MNISYINDLPITNSQQDKLRFSIYSHTLYQLIKSDACVTPLTIGIFGSWGTGKTSLMQMLQNEIKQKDDYLTVWFDAWKYDKEEHLWRALLLQILTEIRKSLGEKPGEKKNDVAIQELEDVVSSLYHTVEREELGNLQIDWVELLKGSLETALHVGIALVPGLNIVQKVIEDVGAKAIKDDPGLLLGAIERARTKIHIEHVQSLEQFQQKFRVLVKNYVHEKGRLVIFVDDLDRCLPEKAVAVLEAIKLFLDVEDCVFIIGVDSEVISRSVELKYREFNLNFTEATSAHQISINGIRYLEKIIQVPFHLPAIEHEQVKHFVESLIQEESWPHTECINVFAAGLGDNPRQVKRAVNTFLLLWEFSRQKAAGMKPVQLAKLVVIQNIYPSLYFILKRNPRLLHEIEKYYSAPKNLGLREKNLEKVQEENAFIPSELLAYSNDPVLLRLFTMHNNTAKELSFENIKSDDLKSYFTLVGHTDAPKAVFSEKTPDFIEPQVLSDGTDGLFFAKFPVTNMEYQAFIHESSYLSPWGRSEYPPDQGNHPVVFVSFEDAKAYCNWLSKKTEKKYRLPTVDEWTTIAKGPNNFTYPWGNEWDDKKANTQESELGETSPVGAFSPQGDSHWGCSDMFGNVWEWCDTWHKGDEKKYRMLKGCAFDVAGKSTTNDEENWDNPNAKYNNVGFRIVLEIEKQEAAP